MLKFNLFLLILLLVFSCGNIPSDVVEPNEIITSPAELYGVPLDEYTLVQGEIKPNQFFSELLLPYKISYSLIDQLVRESEALFDVRKMRAGNPFTLFVSQDSLESAKVLVYEIDKVNYIKYDFRDSIHIQVLQKPKYTETKEVVGIIEGSLYLTMLKLGVNPVLSNELAEIYAWTIDFYRIQKGDKFKVVYDEVFVDSVSVGVKRVKYAVFEHAGEEFYAIYFEQDGIGDYYDIESRGLRRQFLKAPVKYSRISSKFSTKRLHPVTGINKPHFGTDYAAPNGTPIMSTANGVIVKAEFNKYNGNYVKVKHNSTYTTQYLHMSKIKPGIKPGVRIKQGDIIGYVGATGLATGPHVCYRFWKNGTQVDPLKERLPKSEPIKSSNLAKFDSIKAKVLDHLNNVSYANESPEV